MIEIVDEYVLVKFQKKFFSVLSDEVSDISNQEQLSLVLTFVNEFNQVREEFLDFTQCSDETSGEALSNIILSILTNY